MKADQKTQTEVTQTLKGMFEAYKKKDLRGVLSYWAPDPDITIIGSGLDEKGVGVNALSQSLNRDWAQADITAIGFKDYTVSAAGDVAWLSAGINFHGIQQGKDFDLPGRLTGVMEKRNGIWLWTQMHFSVPSDEQATGQSWPKPR